MKKGSNPMPPVDYARPAPPPAPPARSLRGIGACVWRLLRTSAAHTPTRPIDWMEAQLQAAYEEGRRVERERAAFVAERYAQRAAIALRAMDAAPGDLAVRLVLETRKNARRNLSLAEEIAAEIRKGATA